MYFWIPEGPDIMTDKILNDIPYKISLARVDQRHLRVSVRHRNDQAQARPFNIFRKNADFAPLQQDDLDSEEADLCSYFSFLFSDTPDSLDRRNWTLAHTIGAGASYYGLGDKAVTPDLRGRKCIIWGTDTYAFPYGAEPLYKNIPFYIETAGDICIGVFINNTYKLEYDFGFTKRSELAIHAAGGPVDIYFIRGENPIDIIARYTLLTGPASLPPLWALGYHQSKWSYAPESELKEVAVELRRQNIPCDCLYLDIDYMDGYRVFTWDPEAFPHPAHLINGLRELGYKTIAILDPGIKIDKKYAIYKEGVKNQLFLKAADGKDATGPVWPGYCHFPDFTDQKVRDWWAGHVEELMKTGLAGLWNDMNEPALFNRDDMIQTQRTLDDDVKMSFEGRGGYFSEGHNIYGMLMSEATMAGIARAGDKRPFVLTRSTYAGGQKFAAVWTGDNVASWEHLRIANYQCQNLSVSGFSFAGSDVGGFVGNPDGALFCRWLQLALFHPFFRTHSSKDFDAQEPWSFGEEWTDTARRIIEWRYRLLGYIYTVFQQYCESGVPMLKPLCLEHWPDHRFKRHFDQFYLGRSLLVVPVMEPGQSGVDVFLPEGHYYDLETQMHYEGGRYHFVQSGIDSPPALMKGGHVIPVWPVMQYCGERSLDEIELWCGWSDGQNIESSMYLDDLEGFAYRDDNYLKVYFIYSANDSSVELYINKQGNYVAGIKKYTFRFSGIPHEIRSVTTGDGTKVPFKISGNVILFNLSELPDRVLLER